MLANEINARLVTGSKWIGKTIANVIDEDGGEEVVFLFTDGTFGIVDADSEGDGCGTNHNNLIDPERIKKIGKLLDGLRP